MKTQRFLVYMFFQFLLSRNAWVHLSWSPAQCSGYLRVLFPASRRPQQQGDSSQSESESSQEEEEDEEEEDDLDEIYENEKPKIKVMQNW